MKKATEKRKQLTADQKGVYWIGVKKRAGKRKVTEWLLQLL
jgi:hypothetical protein